MPIRYFYSDNDTDTFADVLKAVGLAEVLRALLRTLDLAADPITIEDKGGYYCIGIPHSLDQDAISRVEHPFVAGRGELLMSAKQIDKARKDGRPAEGFPYDEMQEQKSRYLALLENLSKSDQARYENNPNADEFAEILRLKPHPDLSLYVYVNHFKVADGYNAALRLWRGSTIEAFRANLAFIVDAFTSHPNHLDAAIARWKDRMGGDSNKSEATLLQLVNPASGKGANYPKASSLSIGSLSGFWLLEYLKFVGLFTAAIPLLVQDSKDRKTYVLRPHLITLNALRSTMDSFRARIYPSTAVKLDVLAALRFTQTILTYMRDALTARETSDPLLELLGEVPRVTDIAQGFDVGFYKDMGSAYATMNLATVNLPTWMAPISSLQWVDQSLALLSEHERVVLSIRSTKGDEGSEELELLRRYRDFLSGHDSLRFFDFAARYGDYYLAKRARNQWAEQFTTEGMEALMVQSQSKRTFAHVIEAEGFREIAAAIRRATVTAQYQATRVSGFPFEIRYGLGQELLRAANYPDTFLAALGEFVHSYNAENARVDERIQKGSLRDDPRFRRAMVRTSSLDDIVRLVDSFGSDVICKMLVAYGYARDPRAPSDPAAPEPVAARQQPAQ